MTDDQSQAESADQQRRLALSRWDGEGGAGPCGPQDGTKSGDWSFEVPRPANAELVQLHTRVIALENLVITLLAEASDQQLDLARDMAAYISRRPGYTRHPPTIHAAIQMLNLVERAAQFRAKTPF